MGKQSHAALMVKLGYEGPKAGRVAGHLPCPIGMAVRPCLAGRRVLDTVSMTRQVRLDGLDRDNMRVRAKIEDLRRERMG